MTPARVTKSRMAQVKSALTIMTVLNRWLEKCERTTIFFAWIAQAVQTNAQCFQTANPWHMNGKP